MISVKSSDLWSELEKLFKTARNIKAAIAYVSDDSCISFKKGDVLVVDASDVSISGARTSARVLKAAYERDVKIYSCDTLHGKVIVFDQKAYIGSANISKNSKERLDEIGVISDHPNVMSGAVQIINDLASQSIAIDGDFIKRILKIDVKVSDFPKNKKPRKVDIGKPYTWLVSLRNDADYPGDENRVEEENELMETIDNEEPAWFWMKKGHPVFGNAKIGDSVVIIERDKKESLNPERAYRHFVIKNITCDNDTNTRAYHYARVKDYVIKWSSFKKLAEKSGITRLGSGLNTARKLTEKQSNILFELWDIN